MTKSEIALEELRCRAEAWALKESIAWAMHLKAREWKEKLGKIHGLVIPRQAYERALGAVTLCLLELQHCKGKHVEYGEKYHELRRELEAIGSEASEL